LATHDDSEDFEDQLADSRAQIEALQAAAADAEARAATAQSELAEAREALSSAQTTIREAAAKYRAAVLASAPDIPEDLVPEAEDIAEIDRGIEAARRVVGRVREKMEAETADQARALRVPAGAPVRRAPDVSALSPEDKIRLGLQQAAEREGR
jgi:chromosome segregation ATPase